MTASFVTHLALLILPMLCLFLLALTLLQLDLGAPECAPPRLTPGWSEPSQREEWAADFAAIREEIAAQKPDHIGRPPRKVHDDWPYTTQEFQMKWDQFFAGQADDQAVNREWIGAGR